MINLIEKNYYKINLLFISIMAVYCMCGLIVPLQFISANKIMTAGMTLLGILLGTYNLLVKKVYLKIKGIEYLVLFFVFNIITCLLVVSYGFSTNLKNMIVFYIYFFTVFPMFATITKEESKKIINVFFIIITIMNTVGVIVSLVQFILLKGYRVHDYKGLLIRQGFVESRLFGILASPNFLSIVSLIVIVYLIGKITKLEGIYRYLSIVSILCNFIYIVLSGSRTAYICAIVSTLVYSLSIVYKKGNLKSLLKVLAVIGVVLFSYKAINFSSEKYLEYNKIILEGNHKINLENKGADENNLSLERTDTSEENISNNRFAIWESTIKFVPKRPVFGYSSGNWYAVGKNIKPDEYIIKEHYLTHNGYLELLFYNGIAGTAALGVFILMFVISLVKKIIGIKKENESVNVELAMIAVISVVIFISNLFLSATLYGISILGMILFLIIGYYFSIVSKYKVGYRSMNTDEIKEVELGIMDYIHRICQKENINYSLAYGTLLGAIRHKGFIPWDDDIDIALIRNEYDKLYDAIKRDNDSIYKVVSHKNDARYPYPFYRVYDSRTVYENSYINNDIELGICVDVFPFDNYKDVNSEMKKLDIFRQLSVYTLYGVNSKNTGLKNIVRYFLVILFRITRVKTWNEKMNNLAKNNLEAEYIDYLMEKKNYSTKIEKNSLDDIIDCSFEKRQYKIPKKYDSILRIIYGDDYMEIPPKEKRISHDNFVAYIKKEV